MATDAPNRLFTYGTLRPAFQHPMHALLQTGAVREGTATFSGRLYDLGAYPGAVPPETPDDEITGEVYRLKRGHRDELLRRLDRYEGADPDRPQAGLFRREVHPVTFEDGDTVQACIYLYNHSVGEAAVVPSGDYAAFRGRS